MKFPISLSNTKEKMNNANIGRSKFKRCSSFNEQSSYKWRKYLKIKYMTQTQRFHQSTYLHVQRQLRGRSWIVQKKKLFESELIKVSTFKSNKVKETFWNVYNDSRTCRLHHSRSFHFKCLGHSTRKSMCEIWVDIQVKRIQV